MQDQGLGLELLHWGVAGVYGRASGLSSTEGEQGMYGCARGASSSLVWRARGASSPVRWPRTFKVRKKSLLAMSTDIAPISSMVDGLALKFEEDFVFKCP